MSTLITPLDGLHPIEDPLVAMRVLLVDDNPVNLELLEEMLGQAGFSELRCLTDPARILAVCGSWQPDLVLLDLHMPGRTGYEVLAELGDPTRGLDDVPVIVVTADNGLPARHRALAAGARDFVTKPFDTVELELRIRTQLTARRLESQLREQNRELDRTVAERTQELDAARLESLSVLASVAEYHDDDTRRHTHRVGALAALLGSGAGLTSSETEMLQDAAPLHDIGKIGVPTGILQKPGPLTPAERDEMMRHASIGSQILLHASSPVLVLAEEIARTHHERWDGQGYPNGLAGTDIPLSGRIAALADVLDALTHARPYKAAWPIETALAQIERDAGSHFDPDLVDLLLALDDDRLLTTLGLSRSPGV